MLSPLSPLRNAYWLPVGSASCGVGSPSIRHRSMKCSWEAAFSVVVTPRHFWANAAGVKVGWVTAPLSPARSSDHEGPAGVYATHAWWMADEHNL